MNAFPIVAASGLSRTCVFSEAGSISYAEVLYKASKLAEKLPDKPCCMLLCERRDLFITAYLAVLMRKQTLLLPPSKAKTVLQDLLKEYPHAYTLVDEESEDAVACDWTDKLEGKCFDIPELDADHTVAIVFTSGSTGKPVANEKSWGELHQGSRLLQQRLQMDADTAVVATVPPQHMYGLETSVLAPLLLGASVYSGKPFYPADVYQAVSLNSRGKVMLVTTPLHLRACQRSDLSWFGIRQIVSATAPLDGQLAVTTEEEMKARVVEIFGCTETGSFASRYTAIEERWQMYDGMNTERTEQGWRICGGHLAAAVVLADEVEIINDRSFRFLGRRGDMIKIAGKRISLAELNMRLNAVQGVEDAVFVQPRRSNGVGRLMALVVAPDVELTQIRQALSQMFDPVFLPRPLLKVKKLPRNSANKLPRQALDALLAELGY